MIYKTAVKRCIFNFTFNGYLKVAKNRQRSCSNEILSDPKWLLLRVAKFAAFVLSSIIT